MAEQMQPIQSVQEITEPLAIKDQGDIPRFNEASARNLKDIRDLSKNLNDDFIPKWNASRGAVNIVVTNIKAIQDAPAQAANAAKSASAALTSQNAAKASENAAKASQNAAKTSETNAKTSETAAKASQNAAKVSETNAKNSENAALASKNAAKTSETNAANSATAANNSKNAAATSATNAANSATAALASQNAARASVDAAKVAQVAAEAARDKAEVIAGGKFAVEARRVIAGTGLNGGGDLSADRTLTVKYGTAAGTACQGNDARLSNARTPTAHKATHKTGGTDALTPADIGAAANTITVSAGNGLTGGGNLTANRSLAVNYATAAPLMDGAAAVGTSVQLSRGDHRHPSDTSRLPLTGGTMTGNLVVPAAGFFQRVKDAGSNTLRNFRPLSMYGQDGNGAGLAVTANGLTVIGGGESANAVFAAANMTALGLNPGSEHAIVAADSEIWFLSGTQTFANRKLVKITPAGILETAQQIRFLNGQADKIRMIQGNYGFIMHQNGSSFYFLVTASGQQNGTWTSARPLIVDLASGVCNINGNAATATRLQTARTIALSGGATGTATSFNGSANITISVTGLDVSKANAGTLPVARGGTGRTDGKAVALATARTISLVGQVSGSVSFDGSSNVAISTSVSSTVNNYRKMGTRVLGGTWTITNCIINKPLIVVADARAPNGTVWNPLFSHVSIAVQSGAVGGKSWTDGANPGHFPIWAFSNTTLIGGANSFICFPTSSNVVLYVGQAFSSTDSSKLPILTAYN